MNKKQMYKTNVDMTVKIQKTGSFKKALADYIETYPLEGGPVAVDVKGSDIVGLSTEMIERVDGTGGYESIIPLKEFILKQPDLLYVVSTFVSQGANKNWDGFLRPVLANTFETPKHKFVDFEHDVQATDAERNPTKYKVVGHIYDSALVTQETGSIIPFYELVYGEDGKLFNVDSPYRNQGLDIVVAWVLYQFEYPELADMIVSNFLDGDNGKFGVSMEVLFSDYKFRVGEFNPDEEFEFDATTVGKIEARKGTPLAEELFDYWRNRRLYNGQPVTRILGGELFFSGMAITGNRANGRSLNSAVASLGEDTKKDSQIASIMKAIASKNKEFDMSKCEIVDGQPSCNCLEQSIAAQLDLMLNDLKEITALATKKRTDVNPKTGEKKYGDVKFADEKNNKYPIDTEEHIRAGWNYIHQQKNRNKYSPEDAQKIEDKIRAAWKRVIDKDGPPSAAKSDMMDEENDDNIDINQLEDHLKEAQLLLQNLYENNIDNELSGEEIREYLENIDNILNKTNGLIKK